MHRYSNKFIQSIAPLAALTLMGVYGKAFALPSPDAATAAVSVTVDGIMEWSAASFPAISLAAITAQNSTPSSSSDLVLYTNGDVDISADNTATARLTDGTDTLVTEYSLAYDGNGIAATGGTAVSFTGHATFLGTPSGVTHVTQDGAVLVTLGARASNSAGEIADAGAYTATQTLTATWGN